MRRTIRWGLLISFLAMVILPTVMAALYLALFAADQFASRVGFVVRQEEAANPLDFVGGFVGFSASSSSDTDILYEYIQSPEMVLIVDQKLDLRRIWSVPENDPVFRFGPDGSPEDLQDYWNRMVRISYDQGTGLIELRVLAFAAEDARNIAAAVLDESSRIINELSAIARQDTTRLARHELDLSIERLKTAREAMTAFRMRSQIVDPEADINGQMGILGTLQQQLTEALIDHDLLLEVTRTGDTRLDQAQRRIKVIEARISEERDKFSSDASTEGGQAYAMLIAEFERLAVDRRYAEESYTVALAALDTALAESRRQSRYLATYMRPTLPSTAQYPERAILTAIIAGFLLLIWSVLSLIYYSMQDRR